VISFIQTRFANERILDSIEAPAAAGMQTGIFPNARPGFHALIVDHGRPAPLITPPASLSMCGPLEQGPPRLKRP
jgi:hypothetical protein